MKKDKEWLKAQVKDEECELKSVYDNYVPYEKVLIADDVNELIDQLDEPEKVVVSKMEKVVIPQFVADYIKVSKEDNESLNQAFAFIDDKENKELWNWMFPTIYEGKRENQESFARAWLDENYTIEKEPEKLYRVKFPNVTKHGNEMYLDKNDGEDVTSIDWSPKDFVENEDSDDYLFTEQEIKAIDERYWAFAEEVTDNV